MKINESYFKYDKTIILKCMYLPEMQLVHKSQWNLWDLISFQNVVQAGLFVHLVCDVLT